MKCLNMCQNYGKMRVKFIDCESFEDSNLSNEESEAKKGTSKFFTAEWMWNWPETFAVDDRWQDFRSETLLVDIINTLEDEIHLVMSDHLIEQTEENLEYTMTETMKEHQCLAFASKNETSEDPSVQFELLQERAEVTTGLQKVQQRKLFQMTMFYVVTLLLEEENKWLDLNKSYGFEKEQQYTMP